jgi:hypothetical protein
LQHHDLNKNTTTPAFVCYVMREFGVEAIRFCRFLAFGLDSK